jgi:hypothetical protein
MQACSFAALAAQSRAARYSGRAAGPTVGNSPSGPRDPAYSSPHPSQRTDMLISVSYKVTS